MGYPFVQARNYTKGRRKSIRLIVIHDMEAPEAGTTAESVAQYFAGASAPQASAHYNVDDNSIVQSVRESDTAWHAPGANSDGIGVEHAGYAAQRRDQWLDTYSRAELALSAKLTAGIAKRYGIPARRLTVPQILAGQKGFIGHIDATNAFSGGQGHTDPGSNFPWDVYLQMVQAELDALNGKRWSTIRTRAVAAALSVAVAVFSGVSQTNAPAPAPKPVVHVQPAPKAKPVVKPAPKPVHKAKPVVKPAPKTLGVFPLSKGQWYGTKSHNHDAAVLRIQRAVGAVPDGRFGPATETKVKANQRAWHLRPDGLVGYNTWSHLRLP